MFNWMSMCCSINYVVNFSNPFWYSVSWMRDFTNGLCLCSYFLLIEIHWTMAHKPQKVNQIYRAEKSFKTYKTHRAVPWGYISSHNVWGDDRLNPWLSCFKSFRVPRDEDCTAHTPEVGSLVFILIGFNVDLPQIRNTWVQMFTWRTELITLISCRKNHPQCGSTF